MQRTLLKDIQINQPTKIAGYVDSIRNKGNMQFVVLRDASGFIQITLERKTNPEMAENIDKLTVHSFIIVEGKAIDAPYVKNGGREFLPTSLEIDSIAETLPIASDSSQDLRLDYRWVDLRDEKKVLIFKAWTAFEKYATEWLRNHNFLSIHTPKITGLSSEGGSEVFYLKEYFGKPACLTQSPQLYKQLSVIGGLDRTYEIGEYFRANPSFTSRHHCEYTGLDIEMAHIDSHEEIMECEEELLIYVLTNMKKELGEEFKRLYGREMLDVPNKKFPRIPLKEVYRILKEEKNYQVPRELKGDLDPEGERLISQYALEKYGSNFLFVTDFPFKARAFYTKKHEDNPELGKCYDLFFCGLEITSGAQREHRYEVLKQQIEENGIDTSSMQQYLDFFRYGAPKHGGFGLGIGRVLTKLFGFSNVKEADLCFRGPNRLNP